MGIQGLLPLLKSIMVPINVKDLKGCSVAVDTYSWLHKGALSCSQDLCKSRPTSKHIDYCMHRVNLLRHYGVKPVLVFDGGHLPMKNEQEIKRARSRKENLARAIEHESSGNASAAYECYQKAVDISPAIAYELIQVLKQENVSYVVAPYEADAQMTFLAISKQVDAVITEDSDLIPFGCPRIIYKMDKFGQGVEFQYSKLQHNKELNLAGFTKQMILEMCILSGCDYLQSLPGMGLKKAHALIKRFRSYDKVVKHLKFSGIVVPPLYEESFRKAIMTFQHQRVYDPLTEEIVHLSDISNNIDEDLDFLGPLIPQLIAKGIASGDIDPFTQLPVQAEFVSPEPLLDGTYNLKSFKSGGESKKLDLPAQKNLLTNYFCFASLEAKRKFRAPRTSPQQPCSTGEIPQPLKDINGESCDADLENRGVNSPTEEPVDTGKPFVLLESLSHDEMRVPQNAKRSIHPCISLQKEKESDSSLCGSDNKTRVEKKPVIVRSSYFKHKSTKNDDQEKKNPNVFLNMTKEKNVNIVKSPYFQHKNDRIHGDIDMNNNEGSTMKRKVAFVDEDIQKENLNHKHMRITESLARQDGCAFDLDDQTPITRSEDEKFGCNISHIGQYSDIAEKSMEKFISVISSFRYTSSGSRASGLRAPLKDIRNTTAKSKSSPTKDLTKFAYVPTKQLPFRRR